MTQPISVIAKSLVRERLRTGLSLAEIARRAGIAKSTLSQLESGNGNPSLETLWSLCVALDIPFARLLEPQQPTTQVIRRGEGTKVVAGQANYEAILLAACPGRTARCLPAHHPAGADRISQPHSPGSVEHIIVTQGRALVGLLDAAEVLEAGITFAIPPTNRISSRPRSQTPTRYWWRNKINQKRKRMSLKAIAKELGLSVTTVSRALNGYDDVSSETRARVEAEAQRRGYRPNTFARRLKMGKIDAVGLVFRYILFRSITAYLWTWSAKLATNWRDMKSISC